MRVLCQRVYGSGLQQRALRDQRCHRTLRLEHLERRELLAGDLAITEFMASNGTTLFDGDGEASDWIEIHNGGADPVGLAGWALTDNARDLDKWQFPALTLEPDQYLVVFASGNDRRPESYRLTRDFHATQDGTFVLNLPEGGYEVRMTFGDAEKVRDDVAVYVQGELLETITTAAGEFAVRTVVTEVNSTTGGRLALRFEDSGGETAQAVVNALVVTAVGGGGQQKYDFGTADSPVEPGYTAVLTTDVYAVGAAYGWLPSDVEVTEKDRATDRDEPHTNFKLGAEGEYVALISPTGVVVSAYGPDGGDYPPQRADISYGITPAGSRYFVAPTPGRANGPGQTGFVSTVDFSVGRGFFTEPFVLAITTRTPGATILYTTDGSIPTEENGSVYAEPITISGITTLRAVALKEDLIPTAIMTQTYLFPADVLQQDGGGLVSAPWGHDGPDWEVDPDIVHHPDQASRLVVDDLLTIPTISLVMNFDEMFGSVPSDGTIVNGIYNIGEGVEKATSVELLNPDGSEGFQIDASVQIVGGTSPERWKSDKLSMRLKFNADFGSGDLEYPVFGEEAAGTFDTLVLDAHLNNVWHYGGGSSGATQRTWAQYLRDQYAADLQLAMGGYAPHDKHVHVYINGIYWGMLRLHERPDDNFAASYLGGDNDDYDVIKHNAGTVVHGSNANYLKLLTTVGEDLTDPGNYQAVLDLLDVDDFIDYMLMNFYGGNQDWSHQNWYATYNREDPDGRWRFHSWDAEKVLQGIRDNVTRQRDGGSPTAIHHLLLVNPEYQLRFADHVHRHFFNDGVLTPTRAAALYQVRLEQIDRAVVAESARWGDNQRDIPYTRGVEWVNERDRLLNEYFPQRTRLVLSQLKATDAYPTIDAAELNQHGGRVSPSFGIELSAPRGTVYFTTDGSDPRLPGGAVAADAMEWTGPLHLAWSSTIKARALDNGEWSALTEATFVVVSDLPLRVTEINYNPHDANLVPGLGEVVADNDQFEFIELANVGAETVDLGGVRLAEMAVDGEFQGITFTFAAQSLAPGEHLVVVHDRGAFQSRYGGDVRIASGSSDRGPDGEYGGKLSNNGERITLLDAVGLVIQQFSYGSGDPWPDRTDGWGGSLEIVDGGGDYDNPANWRGSSEFGGSPGRAGAGPAVDVVVNEVLSRGEDGQPDQIELHNRTTRSIDLSGWYLSDTVADLLQAALPPGTTIGAGAYLVLDLVGFGFGLSGTQGDDVWLVESGARGRPLRFADHVELDATDVGVSLGRWPNGDPDAILFPMTGPSFGAANPGPATGEVVISEVHYHPLSNSIVSEDFADGTADGFTPVLGTWAVRNGGYEVTPGSEEDTIATISTHKALPATFVFSATMVARTVGDFKQNVALVIDYHSPTNFKFVSMHPGGDKWRIGQRDASGWNVLKEATARYEIDTDTSVGARIEIDGSLLTLWTDDIYLTHDFETPLNGGQVGVGSKGGAPRFEEVNLERADDTRGVEFLELVGTPARSIDLAGWRLDGGVELVFPPGTSIGSGEGLVVVGFNPADLRQAESFRAAYGIAESVTLVGPYDETLSDSGDVLRLFKPVTPGAENPGFVLVDRITYSGRSPWPTEADGYGAALSRASAEAFGDFASSWSALAPTPGTVRFAMTGDLNFDGSVDAGDIEGFARVLADPAAYAAAYGRPATLVADADGDGDADFDDVDDFVILVVGGVPASAAQADGGMGAMVTVAGPGNPDTDALPAGGCQSGPSHVATSPAAISLGSRPDPRMGRHDAALARQSARRDLARSSSAQRVRDDHGSFPSALTDRVLEQESIWLDDLAVRSRRLGR